VICNDEDTDGRARVTSINCLFSRGLYCINLLCVTVYISQYNFVLCNLAVYFILLLKKINLT